MMAQEATVTTSEISALVALARYRYPHQPAEGLLLGLADSLGLEVDEGQIEELIAEWKARDAAKREQEGAQEEELARLIALAHLAGRNEEREALEARARERGYQNMIPRVTRAIRAIRAIQEETLLADLLLDVDLSGLDDGPGEELAA
jgi:hypothetical protein